MKKIALAVIMSAFAVTAMSAPVLAAKKKALLASAAR